MGKLDLREYDIELEELRYRLLNKECSWDIIDRALIPIELIDARKFYIELHFNSDIWELQNTINSLNW